MTTQYGTDFLTVLMSYPLTPGAQQSQIAQCFLKADTITTQINRTASIIPLPATILSSQATNIFSQRPVAWVLDLGLIQETVVLRGYSSDQEPWPDVPTAAQLDEIARCVSIGIGTGIIAGRFGMANAVMLEVYNGPAIPKVSGRGTTTQVPSVSPVSVYAGVIMSFTKTRTGGETQWSWTLTLGVADWTQDLFQSSTPIPYQIPLIPPNL